MMTCLRRRPGLHLRPEVVVRVADKKVLGSGRLMTSADDLTY